MLRILTAISLTALSCSGDKALTVYNSAPAATITNPIDGQEFEAGTEVSLSGIVSDSGTSSEDLSVTWGSDQDGVLTDASEVDIDGLTLFSTASLTAGTSHTISLRVVDTGGKSATDTVVISINEAIPDDVVEEPSIVILSPHPSGSDSPWEEGTAFPLEARISDHQDAPESLNVTIENVNPDDGTLELLCEPEPYLLEDTDDEAYVFCEAMLEPGLQTMIFTVIDSEGFVGTSETELDVISGDAVDNDGDGFTENEGDCDDTDEDIHPGAPEIVNGVDDDCNGLIDDGTSAYDNDGDGYSADEGDCDDTDPAIFPGAVEESESGECMIDADGDGYGSASPPPGFAVGTDCDDTLAEINPGATEICDGFDNDCSGVIDGADAVDATVFYQDLDGDGYGNSAVTLRACEAVVGYVSDNTDCNDTDSDAFPGGIEVCDGIDNDCSGSIDEDGAIGCTTWYQDLDGDGYGSTVSACSCSASGDFDSDNDDDCYDFNSSVNPVHSLYHTTNRGDGLYDYNCDSIETRRWTVTSDTCGFFDDFGCSSANGWAGSVPACGETATWKENCSYSTSGAPWDWGCYFETTESRTQSCL